jgi:hypothetical protein
MCCATRQLGKEFVEANKRNRGERTRQGYLRIIHDFRPTALQIRQAQMARPWMELAEGVRIARYGLRAILGRAFDVLAQAASTGAALTIPERVLVSKWMETNDDEQRDNGQERKDRYIWIENEVGRVPGAALFVGGDPTAIVKDLERILQNYQRIATDTDSHTTGQLRQLVKLLRSGRQGLERLLLMKRAADTVFTDENAAFIAGWINQNRSAQGKKFPHIIRARNGELANEVMRQHISKPQLMEPEPDLIALLTAL